MNNDFLDRNIAKLLRGAKEPETPLSGAQERVFKNVMNRLSEQKEPQPMTHSDSTYPVTSFKSKSNKWVLAIGVSLTAAAACIALVLTFNPSEIKPVAVIQPDEIIIQPSKPLPVPDPNLSGTMQPTVAAVAEVRRLQPPQGHDLQETLKDGSVILVAGGSDLEISTWPSRSRPLLNLLRGSVDCQVAKISNQTQASPSVNAPQTDRPGISSSRFIVKTPAGVATALGTHFTVSLLIESRSTPLTLTMSEATGSNLVMAVHVLEGEVLVRDLAGTEQFAAAGDTCKVGGPPTSSQELVENWRSGQLVPHLEDGSRGDPLEVRRHTVKATIKEQVAVVEVDQVFYNPGNQRMEGTFFFPLPHKATICRLAMYVGDNLMEGEIADAQRARRTFEALKVQRVDPALLEWAGGNLFKMRVFPIEPKSEKRVLISYIEVLRKDHNRCTFNYPLASDALQKHPVGQINIQVTVDSTPEILTSQTPGLDARIERDAANHHLQATYTAKSLTPEKDFRLQFELAKGQAEVVVVPYWHARRNEGYFMMIFSPELEHSVSDKVRGSEFIFVVEKSGGLGARQLALAVKTTNLALNALKPYDRFAIVAYDTVAQTFRSQMVPATPENIEAAGQWLHKLEAFGASDLSQAWKAVAALETATETQLVYLGSGLSSLTSTQSGKLMATAEGVLTGRDFRVHCLALGAVQDATFLSELSKKYGGTLRSIHDADDAVQVTEELMNDYYWPLYRNVEISFGDLPIEEIYPVKLPNVTAGRQLFVFGRYIPVRAAEYLGWDGTVKLSAMRDNTPYEKTLPVRIGLEATDTFVPRLWATRRIEQLQNEAALASGEQGQELIQSVIETSKRYRVMSQHTSFIVLETAEDYLSYGIERRPDEFSKESMDFEVLTTIEQGRFGYLDGSDGMFRRDRIAVNRVEVVEKESGGELKSLHQAAKGGQELLEKTITISNSLQKAAPLLAGLAMPNEKAAAFASAPRAGKELFYLEQSGRMDKKRAANAFSSAIETLPWERRELFPRFNRPTLSKWNPKWVHGEARALQIFTGLAQRVKNLSVIVNYGTMNDGKEVDQKMDLKIVLDTESGAFTCHGQKDDFVDVCDGQQYVRLFPNLKYAARRKTCAEDLPNLAERLPEFFMPWTGMIDQKWLASIEREGPDEIVLRLVNRNDKQSYILVYLTTASGPIVKIEYFERLWTNGGQTSEKKRTVLAEAIQEIGGIKVPTVFRETKHDGENNIESNVIRFSQLKINEKPDAAQFKAEIPADWTVRELDATPSTKEIHPLSNPVNPRGGR